MSLQGSIPKLFSDLHPRYKTPYVSIIFLGSLVFALACSGSFIWLAGVTSLARLIMYTLCLLSIPALRKKSARTNEAITDDDQDAWKLPVFVPVLGLMTCGFLLYQISGSAWVFLGTHVTVGLATYAVLKRRRRPKAVTQEIEARAERPREVQRDRAV